MKMIASWVKMGMLAAALVAWNGILAQTAETTPQNKPEAAAPAEASASSEGLDPELAKLLGADEAKPMAPAANAAQLEMPNKNAPKQNPWVEAIKKMKYKLAVTGYAFTRDQSGHVADDHQTDMGSYAMLFADTSVKLYPDTTLKIDWRANFGTETDNYHIENPFDTYCQSEIRPIDINQLFVQQKIEDFDVTFGKQKIDIGMNTLYSPNNRISPYDGHFPGDPQALGVYQVALAYYHDNSTTELHYMPFYQDNKSPHALSRWATGRGDNGTLDYDLPSTTIPTNLTLTNDQVNGHADQPNFLAREKLVLGSWDLQGNFYYGVLPMKTIYKTSDTTGETTQIRGYMPSLAASTTTGKIAWNGEVLFSIPENSEEDTYVNFCIGGQYDLNNLLEWGFVDNVKLITEYAYEWTLVRQTNDLFPVRNNEARPGRNSFFNYLSIGIDDKRRLYYGTTINIQDLNYGNRAGFEFKSADNINFELFYEWYAGPSKTLFGSWSYNDMIGSKLTFLY